MFCITFQYKAPRGGCCCAPPDPLSSLLCPKCLVTPSVVTSCLVTSCVVVLIVMCPHAWFLHHFPGLVRFSSAVCGSQVSPLSLVSSCVFIPSVCRSSLSHPVFCACLFSPSVKSCFCLIPACHQFFGVLNHTHYSQTGNGF